MYRNFACSYVTYLPDCCPDAVTVAVQLFPDVSLLVAVRVEGRAHQARGSRVVLSVTELLVLQDLICVLPH